MRQLAVLQISVLSWRRHCCGRLILPAMTKTLCATAAGRVMCLRHSESSRLTPKRNFVAYLCRPPQRTLGGMLTHRYRASSPAGIASMDRSARQPKRIDSLTGNCGLSLPALFQRIGTWPHTATLKATAHSLLSPAKRCRPSRSCSFIFCNVVRCSGRETLLSPVGNVLAFRCPTPSEALAQEGDVSACARFILRLCLKLVSCPRRPLLPERTT